MNRAELCIPRILEHEGGYVNHPNDPGGPTNKGITLKTFRRYIKPSGTIADLKALSTAQAVVVYKRQYWDKVNADLLPHGVDYAVADFAVNSGPTRAAKYLQAVVGAKQDGRIGPSTIAKVKAMPAAHVIQGLCDDRLAFLQRLKTWPTFGRGWAARVKRVREMALIDARNVTTFHDVGNTDTTLQPAPPATEIPAQGAWAAFVAAILQILGGRK